MKEKIVLAYSGGLDTTAIIPWLKENYEGCGIVACCVDVGQVHDYGEVERKGIATGADKVCVIDARDEFIDDFLFPMIKANAVYEGKYLLGTSAARPLIAKKLVDIALAENATAVCHGATGKGNDQIRFELTIRSFAPGMSIIAPWRIWDIKSREDAMEYLRRRGFDLPMTREQSYSRDQNIWHSSHEGLELENPGIEPDLRKVLQISLTPEDAPDKPEYVELGFERGVPLTLGGISMKPGALLCALNEIGGRNGIGIADLVENRVVGMKSRGVYETPGGTILYTAHSELESMCLDCQTTSYKTIISQKLGELIYNGQWYTPLREALSAFIDKTQEPVTGSVCLKLYKGNIIPASRTSPFSLYDQALSSFTTGDLYDHKDAEGFIRLTGLPMTVRALMKQRNTSEGR